MFEKSSGFRTSIFRTAVVALAVAGIGACGAEGGFIPGTGDVVGTFNYQGVNYTLQKDGTISRVSTDDGAFYDVISGGSAMNFTAANGDTFTVADLGTGTLTITFNIDGAGAGTLTVDGVPTSAKLKNSTAHDGGAITDGGTDTHTSTSTACADLIETCENTSFFLEVIFPIIREEVIQAIVNAKTTDPFAQIGVRVIAEAMVDKEINKALEFCAGVQFLSLIEAPPCDH